VSQGDISTTILWALLMAAGTIITLEDIIMIQIKKIHPLKVTTV
jgi:hypothetical protein